MNSEDIVPSLARRLISTFPESPLLLKSLSREPLYQNINSCDIMQPTDIQNGTANITYDDVFLDDTSEEKNMSPGTVANEMKNLQLTSVPSHDKRDSDGNQPDDYSSSNASRLTVKASSCSSSFDSDNCMAKKLIESEHSKDVNINNYQSAIKNSDMEFSAVMKSNSSITNANEASFSMASAITECSESDTENEIGDRCVIPFLKSISKEDQYINGMKGVEPLKVVSEWNLCVPRRSMDDFKIASENDCKGMRIWPPLASKSERRQNAHNDKIHVKHIVLTSFHVR